MLTIAKITDIKKGAGYEIMNDFCLIRDAKKYEEHKVYVCKILNRFEDRKGNIHFAVTPISGPITSISYALAREIYLGFSDGIRHLLSQNCPEELCQIREKASEPNYTVEEVNDEEQELYSEWVQTYFASLSESEGTDLENR